MQLISIDVRRWWLSGQRSVLNLPSNVNLIHVCICQSEHHSTFIHNMDNVHFYDYKKITVVILCFILYFANTITINKKKKSTGDINYWSTRVTFLFLCLNSDCQEIRNVCLTVNGRIPGKTKVIKTVSGTCLLLRGDPWGWMCRSGLDGLLCDLGCQWSLQTLSPPPSF